MTLLIACLLIYNFHMDGGWYLFAGILWLLHVAAHDTPSHNDDWSWLRAKLNEAAQRGRG